MEEWHLEKDFNGMLFVELNIHHPIFEIGLQNPYENSV